MPRDTISIEELRVNCVIGVYPEERLREQLVILDLELYGDTSRAGHSGKLRFSCDYDRLAEELSTLLRFRRYRLLETATEELSALAFGLHPWIESMRLKIRKPLALDGRARGAGVCVQRERADYPRGFESSRFGSVDILFESREAGLYLLNVDPGASIPAHRHEKMRELEWLVSGEIERDGRRLRGPEAIEWPKGQVHRYFNPSAKVATLFCCDSPPFIPSDEIEVQITAPIAKHDVGGEDTPKKDSEARKLKEADT